MSQGIQLLLTDARGIYIPRDAVDFLIDERWSGFDKKLLENLSDPYKEFYWDDWDNILSNAEFTDENGNTWHLWQDGDLFAYCDALMTEEEKENFFEAY